WCTRRRREQLATGAVPMEPRENLETRGETRLAESRRTWTGRATAGAAHDARALLSDRGEICQTTPRRTRPVRARGNQVSWRRRRFRATVADSQPKATHGRSFAADTPAGPPGDQADGSAVNPRNLP